MVKLLSELNQDQQFIPIPQSPDYAGLVKVWAGNAGNIPPNWGLCNNGSYLINDYPDLYGIVGTKYGDGDTPGTSFAVPSGPWKSLMVDLSLQLFDSFTKDYAHGFVESDMFGKYWLNFWIRITGGNLTGPAETAVYIDGVTARGSPVDTPQAIIVYPENGQPAIGCRVTADTGIPFQARMSGEGTNSIFSLQGKVELAGAPTDAFVGADPAFTTMADAWDGIPIIKLYDDNNARVSISTI
jgi:hypothetical protein